MAAKRKSKNVLSGYTASTKEATLNKLKVVAPTLQRNIDLTSPSWFKDNFQLKNAGRCPVTIGQLNGMKGITEQLGQAALNTNKIHQILFGPQGLVKQPSRPEPLYEDIKIGLIKGQEHINPSIVGGRHRLSSIITLANSLISDPKAVNNTIISVETITYATEEQRNNAVACSNGSRTEGAVEKKSRMLITEGVEITSKASIREGFKSLKASGSHTTAALQLYFIAEVRTNFTRQMPESLASGITSLLWMEIRSMEGITTGRIKDNFSEQLFDLFDYLVPNIVGFYQQYLSKNNINSLPSQSKSNFYEELLDWAFDLSEVNDFLDLVTLPAANN